MYPLLAYKIFHFCGKRVRPCLKRSTESTVSRGVSPVPADTTTPTERTSASRPSARITQFISCTWAQSSAVDPDPDSMGTLDPYSDPEGQKWHKHRQNLKVFICIFFCFSFWSFLDPDLLAMNPDPQLWHNLMYLPVHLYLAVFSVDGI